MSDGTISNAYQKQWAQPVVVCLCGSMRFYKAFQKANHAETLAGRIVLSVPDTATDEDHGIASDSDLKAMLDELHLRKIDMCDEVLILNVDGYIGPSTWNELCYAVGQAKRVRFLDRKAGAELLQKVFAAFGGAVVAVCDAVFDPEGTTAERAPCALAAGHEGRHEDENGTYWVRSSAKEAAS